MQYDINNHNNQSKLSKKGSTHHNTKLVNWMQEKEKLWNPYFDVDWLSIISCNILGVPHPHKRKWEQAKQTTTKRKKKKKRKKEKIRYLCVANENYHHTFHSQHFLLLKNNQTYGRLDRGFEKGASCIRCIVPTPRPYPRTPFPFHCSINDPNCQGEEETIKRSPWIVANSTPLIEHNHPSNMGVSGMG